MIIEQLKTQYASLDLANLHALLQLYDEDVIFEDPLHKICGREALGEYFTHLIAHLDECRFVFNHQLIDNDRAVLTWTMTYRHPKLKQGEPIHVEGCSWLQFNERITAHRDYFDVSQMLFDPLPLIGRLSQWLKHKASS